MHLQILTYVVEFGACSNFGCPPFLISFLYWSIVFIHNIPLVQVVVSNGILVTSSTYYNDFFFFNFFEIKLIN